MCSRSSSSILYLCICHHGHQLPNINCYQTLVLAAEMICATRKLLIKNSQFSILNKSLSALRMASNLSSQLPDMKTFLLTEMLERDRCSELHY